MTVMESEEKPELTVCQMRRCRVRIESNSIAISVLVTLKERSAYFKSIFQSSASGIEMKGLSKIHRLKTWEI